MSVTTPAEAPVKSGVSLLRTLPRFTTAQRWEHLILLVSVGVLLLTGLPQKYRTAEWSQQILSTPERLYTLQNIHHAAAILLLLLGAYHVGLAVYQLARRRLSGEMLPTLQDVRDAVQMMRYLLFLTDEKPRFGKYNFEQKFTYWFIFFALAIMGFSGLILWFPLAFTRIFPGGMIPAAKLAHSNEAVAMAVFILIWHFYHVHFERLNLSIFTGWLNEEDTRNFHPLEYEQLTGEPASPAQKRGNK